MKKPYIKSIALAIVLALTLGLTACTYRANGSVIQDVTFNVSYENLEGENVDVDATLSLYKTFAPKTCDHLLKQVKNGFYEKTIDYQSGKNKRNDQKGRNKGCRKGEPHNRDNTH